MSRLEFLNYFLALSQFISEAAFLVAKCLFLKNKRLNCLTSRAILNNSVLSLHMLQNSIFCSSKVSSLRLKIPPLILIKNNLKDILEIWRFYDSIILPMPTLRFRKTFASLSVGHHQHSFSQRISYDRFCLCMSVHLIVSQTS